MARIFSLLTFIFLFHTVFAQNVSYPVYLFGNTATKPLSPESYTLLKQEIDRQNNPFTIVHLGDIALNKGWSENPKPEDALRLEQLVNLVKDNPKGKIIFIPGDKDWNNSGKEGLKAVRRLEKYLQSRLPYKNGFVPGSGCPGPEVLDVNPLLRIVAINSSWWMHPYDKPEVTDTDCKILTRQEFVEELQEEITEADNRNILVVGHHPVVSNGVYGGRMTLKKHIFPLSDKNPRNRIPLPVFGSIYAAYRQNIGTPRDLSNFRYEAFREQMQKIFKQSPGLIYASAHEYNLQLNYTDETYHLISGSLTEKEAVGKSPETMFSAAKTGFTKLEYFPNGEVKVHFFELNRASVAPLNSQTLLQSPCADFSDSLAPTNRFFIPCVAPDSVPDTYMEIQNGKVTVVPGPQYKANWLKKIFFGRLYRTTWTTPVQVPLLDLRKTYGGLKPVGRGGGRQTTSLQFRSRSGRDLVFRSVDKDPVKALPLALRETFVTNVLRDITATEQPYGAIIVSALLDSTDILHARPQLYVLPNDPALGPYRAQYAGLFGMLEDRPVDPEKGKKGFAGADDVIRTYSLFRKLYDDHDNRLDAYAFGKARAFDIWVGDFGKHDDNWRWAGFKNQQGERIYKPIPRDRDHAFSRWDGFFPWLADQPFGVKTIQNFGHDYKGIRSLTHPARHLDRALLQNLSREDWQKIARELQTEMTEATIDKAIAAEPAEVIPVSGNLIAHKLKNRIKKLPKAVDEFYENLALVVDVVGSNKNEYFKVERLPGNMVRVRQYEKDKETNGPEGEAYFDRTFYPHETQEIRIFALDGKDVIDITGSSESSILVRVIGGEGEDIIRDNSLVPGRKHYTRVYDVTKTELQAGPETKDMRSNALNINDYNRQEFRYNYMSPIPGIVYNRSDGLGASLTLKLGRYAFREPEEKRIYTVDIRGTNKGAFQLTGGGIWHNVWQTWSVGGLASYGSYFPHYNFFGLGNNTKKDDNLYDENFYRSRYKGLRLNGFTQTTFLRKSTFRIGPLYEYLVSKPKNGTILNEETARDLITGKESLLGGLTELDFDLRDNASFTTKGLRFKFSHTTYQRLTREKNAFGLTGLSGQYFGTARIKIPVTLAVKLGGARNYGKDLPFYKYTSLGLSDNLRGYVNNRFFGDRSAYLNTELRFHLGRVRTVVLPFYYGVVAFYDQGKVWYKGSDEGGLHKGYGAGFYIAPIEHRYALNVLFGHSAEEALLVQFSLGLVLDR
ncbi:hypothetical protein I5M27_06640 [Adhaeribacter sp. BT258]|uniref:Bacterial surface antigen (D15) domain-containing protein n=1 Tax=Adhaeribacter terrigena TaxID=2793070 RepID=A0ABS1BZR0_9BACT|nr:hypothetical protein [Adhaeribacter terrigena]MBK0402655.1 hypothetical protein [Adhaeribacter terrigena]